MIDSELLSASHEKSTQNRKRHHERVAIRKSTSKTANMSKGAPAKKPSVSTQTERNLAKMPNWTFEDAARDVGHVIIAGIDEAGRGPWAGPVVAGAAILDRDNLSSALRTGLDDSKKLKPTPVNSCSPNSRLPPALVLGRPVSMRLTS